MARQQAKAKVTKILSRMPKNKLVTFIILIAVIVFVVFDYFAEPPAKVNAGVDGEISIHFLDVDQGDSALIKCGDKAILIDAGEVEQGPRVLDYLRNNGVERLDAFIATHPHSDHIGGMSMVLKKIDVEKIYMPKLPASLVPTTKEYENLIKDIVSRKIPVSFLERDTVLFENDLRLDIYVAKNEYDNLNNYSLVTRVSFNDVAALFTGDIETKAEKDLLKSGVDLSADLLKVAHHGSKTSSYRPFITAVNPANAVISAGGSNSFGHPHKEVVEKRLKGIKLHLTALSGDIVYNYKDGALELAS